jgi:hypothetical protein
MEINKQTAKQLSQEIQEALRVVAERHGLEVAVRGGTYDPTGEYKPRIVFTTATKAEDEFRQYAELYDLDPDDFGREFSTGGKTFRISGLSPNSRTRPILATEVSTEKTYKFTVDGAKQALALAKVAS